MYVRRMMVLSASLMMLFAAAPATWAQSATSAGIGGTAKDTTGAVLPGVTVEAASPALIEKLRSAVTDGQGNYKIVDLRPGTYTVTFTLPGFGTYKRENLELTTGITANVNAEMKVGSLEETVTVSGASPVVDVQNVRTQNVLTRETLDALPASKNLQSFAALTLGASFSNPQSQDVGGNQGEAGGFGYFSVHGGNAQDQRMTIDGMHFYALIGSGAAGNRTNYVNQMAVAETAIQMRGMGAEFETGGVQINVVPKDGGNHFSGSFMANGTTGRFQNSNLDDALRARGVTVAPKVKEIYDMGAGFGGPLKQDTLWFYTAHRRWGSENTVPGYFFNSTPHTLTYTPDQSRPTFTWIHNRDHQGRMTWQLTSKQKLTFSQGFQWDVNEYYEIDRNRSPEAASRLQWSPNSLTQGTWNYPRTSKLLFEAGNTTLWEDQSNFPLRNGDVSRTDIAVLELSTGFQYGARATGLLNQTDYGEGSRVHISTQRFSTSYVTGSHAFKAGVSMLESWAKTVTAENEIPGLGPVSYVFFNGQPFQVTQWRSPLWGRNRPVIVGLYAQDQWTLRKVTINAGLRVDHIQANDPGEEIPANAFAPALSFGEVKDVPRWNDVTPRLGLAYDMFGNGRTAIKASIGKYVITETNGIALANSPPNRIAKSTNRSWADANGNLRPDCDLANRLANGECGPWLTPSFGSPIPAVTYDPDYIHGFGKRDYDWQGAVTLQQELRARVALNAGYYRTVYGNFRLTTNRALAPADFDAFCITAPTDTRLGSISGQQICGLYDPKRIVAPDNFVTDAANLGKQLQYYDGFEVGLQAHFGKGGLLQGGVSSGRTVNDICDVVRSNPQASWTIASGTGNANSTGSRATDAYCRVVTPMKAQAQVKMLANYPLPWWGIQASANYQNLPGVPVFANLAVSGAQTTLGRPLNIGSANVALVVPQTMFEDRVNQVDVRFAKNLSLGRVRVQGQFDVYNLFNANSILGVNAAYGSAWLKPNAVLGARLFKFGTQIDF